MKRIILLLFTSFYIFYFTNSIQISNAWGPEDESWRRQQYNYRKQTKGAKRIDIYAAYSLYKSGKAILISVDLPDYFKRRHIAGSINVPTEKLNKINLKAFKNKIVLLYCRWVGEVISAGSAIKLMKRGYKKVVVIVGGLDKMPEAGFPLYNKGDIIQKINGKWYKNGKLQ